jgi:hypothetical protein
VDVDVAHLPGGAAQALEQAQRFIRRFPVRRKRRKHREQHELRLDAARGGAELVDRLLAGMGQAGADGCAEQQRRLAQDLHRVCGLSGSGHGVELG